ncbi:MFS transporter [Massilia sp. BJB1822]|nr:MFS transporter [Massilia sp. BJB1822]NVE01514.1 MFS transporter [Massilia sp. BJB1822]
MQGGNIVLLFTLAIGFVMAMIDVTAVNTALGSISADLHVPLSGLVWVVDGYTLTFAAFLLAGGALADRIGARQTYQGGLLVFVAGSLACALAPSGNALVAARLLQGTGAALFMPSSLSLLTHAAPNDTARTRMVGTWSALVGCAATVGPLVGGLLVHEFGWRSVFWINLPLGLAGIVLAQMLAPAPAAHRRPLSMLSHVLGVLTLAALSFLLIEGPVRGWTSASVVAASFFALLFAGVLVWRERAAAHPILPRALLASSSFAAANFTGFLINFAVFGQIFLLSLFFQQAHGSNALETGMKILPMLAASTIGNFLSGRVIARTGTRPSLLGGLAVSALMGAVLTRTGPHTPYLLMMAGVLVMYLAIGLAIPAMTTTVMQVAGKTHANIAAAALNANRQIGALVGVAAMGSILHAVEDWGWRLTLGFGAIGLAYGIACLLVHQRVRQHLPQSGADPDATLQAGH